MLGPLIMTLLASSSAIEPINLRCEALENPQAIATKAPRLSWKLEQVQAASFNLVQTGYRVVVGSQPEGTDLWDSRRVNSPHTFNVLYSGKPLASGQSCWWKVQVFDQNGNASQWSKPALWSVGLLERSDWKAEWIGYDAARPTDPSQDAFHEARWIWSKAGDETNVEKLFVVEPGLVKASLIVSADDQFDLSLNGKKIAKSDGNIDAWKRPVTVDVTSQLKPGDNSLSAHCINSGGAAGFILNLTLEYPNGKETFVGTDETWTATTGDTKEAGNAVVVAAYGGAPWGNFLPHELILTPPPMLRKSFEVSKPVKRAMLYGSALGLIDLHLNGLAVSDELFMPGWTDYTRRVYSRGYDVTKEIKQGDNALGAILGDGWYSGYIGWGHIRDHYGSKPRALVQLNIEYTDGTSDIVASGPDWMATTGPVEYSDFLMGEKFDARTENAAWCTPGNNAGEWKTVDVGAELEPNVEPFPGQPVRAFKELHAQSITEPQPGVYVLNLGQNMAGFARLQVTGKKGDTITLRFAERLSPDGNVYTENLRGAVATDTYICRGKGLETWHPRFTFHGFQYIEVRGLNHWPKRDEVVGIAISSDTPTTGTLHTSDHMMNQLVSNAWWTQRMNFIDIPTDCPQRDERLGWMGDAQAYVRTATMLTNVEPFFTKWLVSVDDAQREDGQFPMVVPVKVAGDDGGPAWADAGVICPWTIYEVYGDKELLARHYPAMKKFVNFCIHRSTSDLLPPQKYHCFGDWLNINSPTPNDVIYTAYFAASTRLTAQAARVLGHDADAAEFEGIYNKLRTVFQKTYVDHNGVVAGNSQCAYVLAIAFDLLDKDFADKAAHHLVDDIEKRGWHLSTGFVGTRDIMNVLSKIGRNDVAFKLLHNTTFPSWGFTIVNGATSIWERWDGWTPDKGFQDAGMNSFAHYAFGAVVGWMFAQPAGITELAPGFTKIKIAPQIDPKLRWLNASYDSISGKIISNWSVTDGALHLVVTVPPNVTAEIHVPALGAHCAQPISGTEVGGDTVYTVGSGHYSFTGQLPSIAVAGK